MPLHPVDAPPAENAHLVALADRCVQCGLCLPHCPTYRLDRLESEGPRGRIAYVKAVAEGRLEPTSAGDLHLDHCLGCRRCEQACPAGVEYESLLIAARSRQYERSKPPVFERFSLAALASPTLGSFAFAAARQLGRLPDVPPAPALPARALSSAPLRGSVTLFPGCIGRDYEAGSRQSLKALLLGCGFDTTDAGFGCCGTAAAHAGDAKTAADLALRNRTCLAMPERPDGADPGRTVLALASGCQSVLAASLSGVADVMDALAFLDREADALTFRPSSSRIALHLPCSQRVLGGGPPLKRLLARIPGLEIVELPDTGCCGAAGLHMISAPERAAALRTPLIEALATSGASQLLSANLGCRLHLAQAAAIPVRHPIDFLAEHLE